MEGSIKTRSITVDVLRGLAMLLVVLGHTLSTSIDNVESSFVYSIIWAIQMPLFMLISGFVTRYSKPIESKKDLLVFVLKRTVSYLIPWIVWTFVIRGIVFGQYAFFNIKWLVYHMDSGYWFLFTIWIISLIYGLADYLSRKMHKIGLINTFCFTLIYGLLSTIILACGLFLGMTFLGTKLTLYYIPFFYLGFLFGRYYIRINDIVRDVTVLVSVFVFFFIISRVSVFDLDESISGILLRATASLTGCIALCGLIKGIAKYSQNLFLKGISFIGKHSLEMYLMHYLLLSPIRIPHLTELQMLMVATANYILTIGLCVIVIKLIENNSIIQKICFGKHFDMWT